MSEKVHKRKYVGNDCICGLYDLRNSGVRSARSKISLTQLEFRCYNKIHPKQ